MKICHASGRLTRLPRAGKNGEAFATIACQTLGAGGAKEDEYVDLFIVGQNAQLLLEKGAIGLDVYVVGAERLKSFERRDGKPGHCNEIFVHFLELPRTRTNGHTQDH